MPTITKEWIDTVAPEHGRTSCSDTDISNGYSFIKTQWMGGVQVKREFDPHPRCNRCFLLEVLVHGLDPRINVTVTVEIGLHQPEFEIVQK